MQRSFRIASRQADQVANFARTWAAALADQLIIFVKDIGGALHLGSFALNFQIIVFAVEWSREERIRKV